MFQNNFSNPYAALMGYNPQPQQNMFSPQIEPAQNLVRVNGVDGAKAYQMPANSTVALFDANEDIMYIKTTDGAGFPAIRLFRFEELKQETAQEVKQDYISRQEFEDFKREVLDNVKQSISRTKSTASNKSADN